MAKLVSKRYSSAIFEYALENNQLEQIQKEFDTFASALIENPDFFELLKTPKLSVDEKKTIITETFGSSLSDEMTNFIHIVIEKKRSVELLNIKHDFDQLVDEHNNIIHATVETVVPLSDDQLNALKESLVNMTGKNVKVNTILKPEILGGVVIKMGDHIIDGSVKFKLQGMLDGLTQIII